MSEVETKQARLLVIFERLLPLVDSVSDKVRFAALLGVGLDVWIFIWLFFLKGFSLSSALIVAGVVMLPLLILLRFWWALEEIKDLPNIAGRMMTDAKGEIQETVQGIRAGQVQKLGFLSSAKSLWSIGSMASEARELVGSYISIGTLVNPLSLILGVLSLLFVLLLVLVGLVLLILAFW
ncbi:hypothetical protein [Thiothrix lacustris]|jgi:hypothetical protein|uniref:ABC transmembrane type-1 domain-containing protein n=1 Tax=Thiothrix lacustris TaxID=525917 RepID=A0ABY9MX73_9GAMM|nr:hypothetical protein [Thiothrix lacustris]WML92345.1 hypothetical protein RCF98_08385 [Thiothrix lacustris]WMP19278.1 hypothetical protein RCS87_09565 [Thiothrix lacustris]